MSDLIKTRKGIFIPDITVEMFRNASLEAVEELLVSGEMQDIILPPAETERKGKWIEYTDCEGKSRRITCDQCGHEERNWLDPNFCPHCGAMMRGEEDEN